MSSDQALAVIEALVAKRVEATVGGGWGVDALLGEETRQHADLDLWLPAAQFDRAIAAFAEISIDRIYPWGDDRPWNFVLHDGSNQRIDLHVYERLTSGDLHYGGVEGGHVIPSEALASSGTINDRPVRCEAPEWALRWHTGYPPRAEDRHDVARLCERFALPLPSGFR